MRIKTQNLILVALFAALMTVGAYVKILFPVVPFSLQPFFCAFAGILLGSRLGALSQIVYLAVGLAGIPVFTQGGGLLYVFKPSFGYLLGFVAGAYVIGKVFELLKEVNMKNILVSVLSGLFVIYAVGIPYVFIILRFYLGDTGATLWSGITSSVLFILKDLAMYIVVAAVACKVLPVLKNIRRQG